MIFHKKKSDDVLLVREIYDKYRHFLYYIAFQILKNEASAEDAVQESIIKVANNIDTIRSFDDNSQRNYIAAICRNVARDMYKVIKRDIVKDDLASYIPDSLATPEDFVINKESYVELVEILDSFDSINVEALKLSRNYKLSVEAVADTLGISVDNAYKRIQRGRKELAEKLEERKCMDNV